MLNRVQRYNKKMEYANFGGDFCQKLSELSEIIGEDPILTDENGDMTCRIMDIEKRKIPHSMSRG